MQTIFKNLIAITLIVLTGYCSTSFGAQATNTTTTVEQQEKIHQLLLTAAQTGQTKLIEGLLKKPGININYTNENGTTALIIAAANGHKNVAELLINVGANKDLQDTYGNSALTLATLNKHKAVIELLLTTGANKDLKDNNGNSALIFAANCGFKDVAELLLNARANKDFQDKNGNSALMLAVNNGHTDVAELLLKAGVNKDLQDKNDHTALMFAAFNGYKDFVELLINAGANKDLQDNNGDSALIFAIIKGHKDVAELLINAGANKELQDKTGTTALIAAQLRGDTAIIDLLSKEPNQNRASANKATLEKAIKTNNLDELKKDLLTLDAGDKKQNSLIRSSFKTASTSKKWDAVKLFIIEGKVELTNDLYQEALDTNNTELLTTLLAISSPEQQIIWQGKLEIHQKTLLANAEQEAAEIARRAQQRADDLERARLHAEQAETEKLKRELADEKRKKEEKQALAEQRGVTPRLETYPKLAHISNQRNNKNKNKQKNQHKTGTAAAKKNTPVTATQTNTSPTKKDRITEAILRGYQGSSTSSTPSPQGRGERMAIAAITQAINAITTSPTEQELTLISTAADESKEVDEEKTESVVPAAPAPRYLPFLDDVHIDRKHIFDGEIDQHGNIKGLHHDYLGQREENDELRTLQQFTNGAYRASVINKTNMMGEAQESTFFPQEWTPDEVMHAIESAYANIIPNSIEDNLQSTICSATGRHNGMEIKLVFENRGNGNAVIKTAYPVLVNALPTHILPKFKKKELS